MHFSHLHLALLLASPFFILSRICYVRNYSRSKLKYLTNNCDGECTFGAYYNETRHEIPLIGCLHDHLKTAKEENDTFLMSKLNYCKENGIYKNFNTNTRSLVCCDYDYCNNPYHLNCYISIGSMENWQESEYKLEQHFPLDTCTALFFTLDYQQLSFRHFINDDLEFQEHLENSLSPNTKLFMEMLRIVQRKFHLQVISEELKEYGRLILIFSVGTTNNPSNDNKLGEQIEGDFNMIIHNSSNWQIFAKNCMYFLKHFGLDGIDIAHGYPDLNAIVEIFKLIRDDDIINGNYIKKHLTFFPAPPANIKNITSKVYMDRNSLGELIDDEIGLNLFYDYNDIKYFMLGYAHWRSICIGVKFTYNQQKMDGSKFNFNGTYKAYFKMADVANRQDISHLQNLIGRISLLAAYTTGLSVIFLDWDHFTYDRLMLLSFVKHLLLNQTDLDQITTNNETVQKEIQNQFQNIKERVEKKELMKKEENKKREYPLGGLIIAFFVLLLILVLILLFVIGLDEADAIPFPFDEMPKIFVKNGFDLNGKNFRLQKRRLGEGSFGRVFLANYTGPKNLEFDSGRLKASLLIEIGQFACKIVKITQEGGEDHVLQEFTTLKDCQHEHIVRAFGVILLRRQIAIVMEFMPFGDLHKHLKTIGKKENQKGPQVKQRLPTEYPTKIASLDEYSSSLLPGTTHTGNNEELPLLEDIHSWMMCVIKAMKYLHGKNILHRDLAARNCLFMDEQRKLLKLGDFGLARFALDYKKEYKCAKDKPIAWPWMAKELVFSEEKTITFTKASDVWSFGVLVWEMCSRGAKPYDAEPGDMERVKSWLERSESGALQLPLARHKLINEQILKPCWEEKRPTFEELEKILHSIMDSPNLEEEKVDSQLSTNTNAEITSPIPTNSNEVRARSRTTSANENGTEKFQTAVEINSLLENEESTSEMQAEEGQGSVCSDAEMEEAKQDESSNSDTEEGEEPMGTEV